MKLSDIQKQLLFNDVAWALPYRADKPMREYLVVINGVPTHTRKPPVSGAVLRPVTIGGHNITAEVYGVIGGELLPAERAVKSQLEDAFDTSIKVKVEKRGNRRGVTISSLS